MTQATEIVHSGGGNVGLYVHIPFCRKLCPYCDFAVAVRKDPPHDAYCDALLHELEARRAELYVPPSTIYFGGGTPAMFAPDALDRFLGAVDRSASTETTLEANPHDISAENLELWHQLGFDRVSLGVQSFDDDALRGLGRDHDGETARRAAERLVGDSRFRSSIDLIYGGPRYDRAVMEGDLKLLEQLGPNHVSAYELTVEANTQFGKRHREGRLELPGSDDVVDWGLELTAALRQLGYDRYEVSSFGRDGDRSRHNSSYWLGQPYVGLGTGAHSLALEPVVRRANVRRLADYLVAPDTPDEVEFVGRADHLGERLMLASRTTLGVAIDPLLREFREPVERVWTELASNGLLEPGPPLRATPRGLDVADAIAQRFWDATHPQS